MSVSQTDPLQRMRNLQVQLDQVREELESPSARKCLGLAIREIHDARRLEEGDRE